MIDVLAAHECAGDDADGAENGNARERCARCHREMLHFLLCLFADVGRHIGAVERFCALEVDLDLCVAAEVACLAHLCDRALAARALREDEGIADEDIVRNLVFNGIADLEILCVDRGHERDLDESVRGDGDGGDGDILRAEGGHRQCGDAFFKRAFAGLAEQCHLHLADALLYGAHACLMVDVPLDGVEVHQDGGRCAVRIDLVVDRVDAGHEAPAAVAAVIVAFEAIDAVNERARLLSAVGVLLDECELGLDGVRRLCCKCRAHGCECEHEGQRERT